MHLTAKQFQSRVLRWFDQHGRKTLPWQYDKTPYRVWVSEIMLQQTQVSTVIPYFERFMQTFPTLTALANASEDRVLHLWTGLGYYSRARNLHRTAKQIVAEQGGHFPADIAALQDLPGIGRSTAGAIVAIAFAKRAAILDGNVKRVLTRLYGIQEWPGEKHVHDALWACAEKLTPTHRVADYTQAMMDLGATVCVRSKPDCSACPLRTACTAHRDGTATSLPKKKITPTLPTRQVTLLILLRNKKCVLLEKRPAKGIWGGLWSLPEMADKPTSAAVKKFCRTQLACDVESLEWGEVFRHTFSHFHLDIRPALLQVVTRGTKQMASDQQIWYNLRQPGAVGLPAPIKKLLLRLTT